MPSIQLRLILLSFLQFFVWGAWLTTIGTYCIEGKHWTFEQFGAIFSTLAISSLFMPSLVGIVADKWIRAERLYGILQLIYAGFLFLIPSVNDPDTLYYYIFGAMICYMPTISLSNSVSYQVLSTTNLDILTHFPKIRVWGTIGFIVAMWVTNQTGSNVNANQFIIGAVGAVVLGIYAFTLPACYPTVNKEKKESLFNQLGLNAFKLFGNYKMALFFVFSMLLGAALQLSNMYGDAFLNSFPPDDFVRKNSGVVLSISQISETVFILTIPFFLKNFGIKKVMLFSMFAWVLRYALFAAGYTDVGLMMIILSCIVYGMAFDFFNISGSMFIEHNTDASIRSSAQGLFMMMTNGFGAYIGTIGSSWLIDNYFISTEGHTEWQGVWISFAIYSLIVAILFAALFHHKHERKQLENQPIQH
jgi:NHS family xanthosine MFS transporter